MLKNCIFHGPVIPCDTLERLILCLTPIDVTQLYLLWVPSFNLISAFVLRRVGSWTGFLTMKLI